MGEQLISIIIPVYNCRQYLQCCIDSILHQTYKNFEILLVDDGSTDGSEEICDKYKTKDKRIKVFHIKNSGQSAARNLALEKARGDFIGFVDSDDWIDENMFKILMSNIIKTGADVSICNSILVYGETPIITTNKTYTTKMVNKENIIKECIFGQKSGTAMWNKVYKKQIFDNIKFPVGRKFEDYWMVCKIFTMTNKIVVDSRELYYYRQRKNSTMYSVSPKIAQDWFDLFSSLRKFDHLKNYYDELGFAYLGLCRDMKCRVIFERRERKEKEKIYKILNKGIVEYCKKDEVSNKTYKKAMNILKRPWIYVPKRWFAESNSSVYIALKKLQNKIFN